MKKAKKISVFAIAVLVGLSFIFTVLNSQVIERGYVWFSCYKEPNPPEDRVGCPYDSQCYADEYDRTSKCEIQCYKWTYDEEGNKTGRKKSGSANCEGSGGGGDDWDWDSWWDDFWWDYYCF